MNRLSAQTLIDLATRTTGRDLAIFTALHTHQVLTTHHVAALFFTDRNSRRARTRLLELHHLGAIERFRPTLSVGTAPWHWVLAPPGAKVLADHQHLSVAELRYRPDRALSIAHSPRLAHTIGVLDTMVAFTITARTTPDTELTWWGETRCAREWGRHVRPDAYARWKTPARTIDVFLEYDTGSEPHGRVTDKLPDYACLAEATAITTPVVFVVPGPGRETNLAEALAHAADTRVPVWLTTRPRLLADGPTAPLWRPADDTRRAPIHELG